MCYIVAPVIIAAALLIPQSGAATPTSIKNTKYRGLVISKESRSHKAVMEVPGKSKIDCGAMCLANDQRNNL